MISVGPWYLVYLKGLVRKKVDVNFIAVLVEVGSFILHDTYIVTFHTARLVSRLLLASTSTNVPLGRGSDKAVNKHFGVSILFPLPPWSYLG